MARFTKEDYYFQVFKKIEIQNENTWNWPAFFFGEYWMLFRKMYLYSFLTGIVDLLITAFLLSALISLKSNPESFSAIHWITLIVHILIKIMLGMYGNRLYYRVVKNRIHKGYHLLRKYRPTTFSALLICWIMLSSFLLIPRVYDIANKEIFYGLRYLFLLIPGVYSLADYITYRSSAQPDPSESLEVDKKNVLAYLSRSNRDGIANNIVKILFIFLAFLSFFTLIYLSKSATNKQIANQMQKIEQEVFSSSN